MEIEVNDIALYPGCSLEGTAAAYRVSFEKVLDALDIGYGELRDWSCCGASSAHAIDPELGMALSARNLALAEQQGVREILAPCAACFHRLASAEAELKNSDALRDKLRERTGITVEGTAHVRNVLDFLAHTVGSVRIAERVTHRLEGLRVASYYGCLNTRTPYVACFDDPTFPTSMDAIVEVLGATAVDWSYKTDCCGGSLFVTAESIAARLVTKILQDAAAREVDCIAVACPMCHNNLDTKQAEIRKAAGIERPIPVLFITQLMGLAFGINESELRLTDGFVSTADVTAKAS